MTDENEILKSIAKLTPKQAIVLFYKCRQFRHEAIMPLLGVTTEDAVQKHVSNIYELFGLKGQSQQEMFDQLLDEVCSEFGKYVVNREDLEQWDEIRAQILEDLPEERVEIDKEKPEEKKPEEDIKYVPPDELGERVDDQDITEEPTPIDPITALRIRQAQQAAEQQRIRDEEEERNRRNITRLVTGCVGGVLLIGILFVLCIVLSAGGWEPLLGLLGVEDGPAPVLQGSPTPLPPDTMFFDDFEGPIDGQKWIMQSGSVIVADGVLTALDKDSWIVAGDNTWKNYSVQFTLRGFEDRGLTWGQEMWVGVRAVDIANMVKVVIGEDGIEWFKVENGDTTPIPRTKKNLESSDGIVTIVVKDPTVEFNLGDTSTSFQQGFFHTGGIIIGFSGESRTAVNDGELPSVDNLVVRELP